jgi:hypothetical protein
VKKKAQRRSMRIILYIFIVAINLVCAEFFIFVFSSTVLKEKMPFLFLKNMQEVTLEEYQEYVSIRHPILGWPAPKLFGQRDFDESGSRVIPSFPNPGESCVSLYGDSFTWGSEVSEEDAWSNVLSKLLHCRVANYGVGGYGVDQAYMRFFLNEKDESDIVVLTIFPHNAMRNVNQWRPLLVGLRGSKFSLKPRFIVSDTGEMKEVPLLSLTYDEFLELRRKPSKFLDQEYFLPEQIAGPIQFEFPYTWFLIKAMNHARVKASILSLITGKPAWSGYFTPDHPSGSFQVATAIVKRFSDEARKRKKFPLIVFLPTPSSVNYFKKTGVWAYQPLIDKISEEQNYSINAGPGFLERLGEQSFCDILTQVSDCGGHFNKRGNTILAEIMHETLLVEKVAPGH